MGSWWSRLVRPEDGEDISASKQELKSAILEAFALQTLTEHLQDMDGWKAFNEFMESEYCGENTRFWLEVEELHSAPDDKVEATARRIYDHYFGPEAKDQVNLPVNIIRGITTSLEQDGPNRGMFDAAQKRILCLMEGSQWHRYPTSSFCNLWVEAKLSNPDSLFSVTPQKDRKNANIAESPSSDLRKDKNSTQTNSSGHSAENDLKEKLRSHLKSKPLQNFLSDPLGFRCFQAYLENSKIGFEYVEYLHFWLEVEAFKDHPGMPLANTIYNKYFVENHSDSGLSVMALPEIFLRELQDSLNANNAPKELFNPAQAHLFNKLKKEGFSRKFFVSDAFFGYLDQLTHLEHSLLVDIEENDAKEMRAQYETGRPTEKGLDFIGFQSVLVTALEHNYQSKFKSKSRLLKWATSFFKKSGVANPGYLSFSEFIQICKEVIREPRIPYHQIELLNQ
eukprot:TRINITY_DN15866_c0_g1_i1.p1 TRINITY_DN15866_c0_g1~~TRINITY_DN15866_c0_g1_i1.p1  ORF type:complete len:451 (-),score=81.42 TRINITY_DN15866_c0_g1_i1:129-1481(-)